MNNCLGIDEAGRGCVLGDLVMAGVSANQKQLAQLQKLPICDSKKFGSSTSAINKRAELCLAIERFCQVTIVKSTPEEIDQFVYQKKLNSLERKSATTILNKNKAQSAIIDGKNIFSPLLKKFSNLSCYDKADESFLIVAAASIVAKNYRDKLLSDYFDSLPDSLQKYRHYGLGYPNEGTFKFIKDYFAIFNKLPSNYRKSYNWKRLQLWINQRQKP